MANNTIKSLRAQRTALDAKIDAAKVARRKAPDAEAKAKSQNDLEKLRTERKSLGAALREERAKITQAG